MNHGKGLIGRDDPATAAQFMPGRASSLVVVVYYSASCIMHAAQLQITPITQTPPATPSHETLHTHPDMFPMPVPHAAVARVLCMRG